MDLRNEFRKERQRLDSLYDDATKLRDVSPGKTIEIMMELNKALNDFAVYQIKREFPNISDAELVKKMRELFWSEREYSKW